LHVNHFFFTIGTKKTYSTYQLAGNSLHPKGLFEQVDPDI